MARPPEGHKVGGQADAIHHQKGEQRREHQVRADDQAGPQIAKKEKQNDDHQNNAFGQHLGDGMDRRIHQLRAVVIGNNLQAAGNHVLAVDFGDPLFHPADNLFGIAAAGHQDDATYGLGVTVLHHGAVTHFRADAHLSHVANVDGRALGLGEHNVADVFEIAHQADAADEILLRVLTQDAPAGIGIIVRQRIAHVIDGQVVVVQLLRIDERFVLLDESAGRINLRYPGDGAQ